MWHCDIKLQTILTKGDISKVIVFSETSKWHFPWNHSTNDDDDDTVFCQKKLPVEEDFYDDDGDDDDDDTNDGGTNDGDSDDGTMVFCQKKIYLWRRISRPSPAIRT